MGYWVLRPALLGPGKIQTSPHRQYCALKWCRSFLPQVGSSGLTRAQAQQVLLVVLKLRFKLDLPGMLIDSDISAANGQPMRPGYVDFALTYDSPDAAATDVLGTWSVDILTGDVLDNTRCRRYRFAALVQLQKAIGARTGAKLPPQAVALRRVGC